MLLLLTRGEHPVVFYGQDYMGTFQAYLGALLIPFFGVSFQAIRVGILLIYLAFLLSFYAVVCRLYTKSFALFILLLLAIGWNGMVGTLIVASGGYPESLLGCALILLLTYYLTSTQSALPRKPSLRRLLTYASIGVLAGLILWSSMLFIPVLLAVAFLLWPFWQTIVGASLLRRAKYSRWLVRPLCLLVLASVLCVCLEGISTPLADAANAPQAYALRANLIQHLLQLGITRMYADY